jgi:hypothetical protein
MKYEGSVGLFRAGEAHDMHGEEKRDREKRGRGIGVYVM